jgi:hypothetical protein
VRPQLAGLVCFTLVFMMTTAPVWRRWYVWAIPVIFACWSNLHGSFIMGLGLLGAMTAGRAVDVWLRTKKLKYVFAEQTVRSLFFALELSATAVLLNPYGIAAYPEVFSVSGSPNMESLLEWAPLTLRMKQGRAAACIALALVACYRLSPRRVTVREVLLLTGLGAAMMWHCRMIVWWAPVAAYYLGLHAAAAWKKYRHAPAPSPARGGLWSVIVVGIAWICFAFTPFGFVVMHGPQKDARAAETQKRNSLSRQTPVEIADYLRRHPPQGQVFNTYEWGDYLLWAGPENLQVFVNSHAHLIPEEVWADYLTIVRGGTGWEEKLDRYGVNMVIVDQFEHGDMIKAIEKLDGWEKKFSDRTGAVFVRKKLI